jgi:hypothetical protein
MTTATTDLQLATTARFPLATLRNLDFVGLGGFTVGYTRVNPDGDDNDNSLSTISLDWGLGIDYWFSSNIGFSGTALNPFASRVSSTQQMPGDDQTTTTTSFGLIFEPNVVFMVHLYF